MDKLWKGRFTSSAHPLMEAFTCSLSFDKELVHEDILGSLAHATMLGAAGILQSDEAKLICQGLIAVSKKIKEKTLSFKESDEDIHMNIERLLALEIGPLAGKLHTGRSRNDQVATDMHLYVRSKILSVCSSILLLQQELILQAEKNKEAILPGYTHLQRAQPILFAQHLLAYVFMLKRDLQRFKDSWDRANQLPLGAAALAGTKHPIDRKFTAELLGFDSLYENSLDAVSNRDCIAEFLFNSAQLMTHLSRLSEELILFSTHEFGFVEIDEEFCSGSSLMPQKKNPDVPELIRGKTGRVFGALFSILTLLKGLPLAYNRDLQEDKEPLFDTVKTVLSVLEILSPLIHSLHVHQDKMLQAAEEGFMNATDLADYLVAKGMAFREAHGLSGKIVHHCLQHKLSLKQLPIELYQGFSSFFSEDVYQAIDLKTVVESKKSLGGTSTSSVNLQLALAKKELEQMSCWLEEKSKRLFEVEQKLFKQEANL